MFSKMSFRNWNVFSYLIVFGVAISLVLSSNPISAEELGPRMNPEDVVGPKACAECHKDTHDLWKGTHHEKTFRAMPRSKAAKKIGKKLGIKRIKKDPTCVNCHFTATASGAKTKLVAGISCESCHGAGKGYADVHSNYGGPPKKTKETETPEHRAERIEVSETNGMIRPERLYLLAENCFQCHTVPNENLVNTGGHAAGSDFELVSWLQGEVRHNVWYTGGKSNPDASPERKRLMYVVGRALDLEYAVRGVAKSTKKAKYAVAMAKRAARAKNSIMEISELVSNSEIEEMVALANGAELKLNNEDQLLAVAEKLKIVTQKFVATASGSDLASVDALIPGPEKYKGTPGSKK